MQIHLTSPTGGDCKGCGKSVDRLFVICYSPETIVDGKKNTGVCTNCLVDVLYDGNFELIPPERKGVGA